MNYLKDEFQELVNQFEGVNSRIESVIVFLSESKAALVAVSFNESVFNREAYKKKIDLENEIAELNRRLSELEAEKVALVQWNHRMLRDCLKNG